MFFNYNIVRVVVVGLCLDLYLCLFSYVLILITFVIKKKVWRFKISPSLVIITITYNGDRSICERHEAFSRGWVSIGARGGKSSSEIRTFIEISTSKILYKVQMYQVRLDLSRYRFFTFFYVFFFRFRSSLSLHTNSTTKNPYYISQHHLKNVTHAQRGDGTVRSKSRTFETFGRVAWSQVSMRWCCQNHISQVQRVRGKSGDWGCGLEIGTDGNQGGGER